MQRGSRVFVVAVLVLGLVASVPAQSPPGSPAFAAATALIQQGQFEAAQVAFQAIVDAEPDNDPAWMNLGICAHYQGDYAAALECYAQAARSTGTRAPALYNTACAHALLGATEPALEALQGAVSAGFANVSLARADTDLASIRGDERFEAILAGGGAPVNTRLQFWVGSWDCYSAKTGQLNGTNEMVSRMGGSVIHEHWQPVGGGGPGESWNYFNPATQTWRQLWVDGSGNPFEYDGKPQGKGILFEGPHNDGKPTTNKKRMFVRPIGNGRVQQTGTQSSDGGRTWAPEYDLVYVPRGEAYPLPAEKSGN